MGHARTSDDRPQNGIGFCTALICNISLIALAIGGARLGYESARTDIYSYEITSRSLNDTRNAIDAAAAALPPAEADRKAYWGGLVKASIDRADLDAAKGYLLLAPQLLPPQDGLALNAALSDPSVKTQRTRSADDRLIQASILLLPQDARAAWTSATAEPDAFAGFMANPLDGLMKIAANVFQPDPEQPADPFALDDPEVLADTARRLVTGQSADSTRFLLNGFVQFLPGTKLADKADAAALRDGASVILGARSGDDLQPAFAALIAARLNAALPETRLRSALLEAYAAPNAKNDAQAFAKALGPAFIKAADAKGVRETIKTLKSVHAIARATTKTGAADLMSHVQTEKDLQRLQLTAQAGGLRTLALSEALHRGVLDLAKGKLRTSTAMGGAAASVALSGLALAGVFIFTLAQAVTRMIERRNRERLRLA